jgi:serine/threonine-protein kinase
MKLISGLQADRLIAQIQGEPDPASPGAKKAFQKLARLGDAAVPKILQALSAADKRQTVEYVELLSTLTNDKSLPVICQGLANPDPRTVSGTAWALSSSRRYNPNRLVDLLSEDGYSKSAIVDILMAHKERLNVRQLLGQVYYLQPSEKAAVFKLVEEMASEDVIPDLLSRMDGKDPVVKMHLINVVSKFEREDVNRTLQEQLKDTNKLVRQAALTGLSKLNGSVDIALICSLLLDPDVDVMNKAVDVIVSMDHPDTAQHLIPALKSENEFSRRSAVEVLNEIGTTANIKHLLEAVSDEDWWVRARASDALARIGGERVVQAVLELIKDKDENVRRAAIEILNTCKDKSAVDHLIQATQDSDWWVSERAADALAGIGDAKALPALVKMLERNDKSMPTALRAIGKVGDHRALDKVLPHLQSADKDVRTAAIEAAADLADEQRAETVRAYIRDSANLQEETVQKIAARAIQKLEGRAAATGELRPATARVAAATATLHTPDALRPEPLSPAAPVGIAEPAAARTLLVDGAEVAAMEAQSAAPSEQLIDLNALQSGDMIEGRYKFIQKIGKGAFGTVVLVEDTVVDDRLILKFLNPNVASDEEMMKRFVHELRYSRKITHKNVIRIYDFLYMGGGYAISMEYFPSHTLGAEIANEKPMNAKKAVGYACDVCTGMQIAHHQGIIHRDLKPANILINDDGLLKIVDFGVAAAAKSGDTQLTKTGYVIGSPKYMAPEQILGKKVDERADIYSLGIILYEMLAGNPPYSRGDHMSVMYQHVQGKAPPLNELNADVPRELSDIVLKAMMVDKTKRYDSMDELGAVLRAAAEKLG